MTINFEASISNGRITSITPNIAYTTAGEKSKTFTIVGRTSDGKEIKTPSITKAIILTKIMVGEY